jgi:hypothetical protein
VSRDALKRRSPHECLCPDLQNAEKQRFVEEKRQYAICPFSRRSSETPPSMDFLEFVEEKISSDENVCGIERAEILHRKNYRVWLLASGDNITEQKGEL